LIKRPNSRRNASACKTKLAWLGGKTFILTFALTCKRASDKQLVGSQCDRLVRKRNSLVETGFGGLPHEIRLMRKRGGRSPPAIAQRNGLVGRTEVWQFPGAHSERTWDAA
jgi:hypothetical protein